MIRAFLGLPGSGKSYSMVEEAVAVYAKTKCQVYTNMSGLKCPEAIYIDSLEDLVHVSNGLVLLDEAGVSLSSRYWQGVSRDLLMRFAQVRKDGLDLWWTAQHENRVDTVLKEITNEYVRCSKFGRYVWKHTELPENKDVTVRKVLTTLKPSIMRLYDTFEVIAVDGGSAGRGAATLEDRSALARRRNVEDRRAAITRQEQGRIPLFYQSVLSDGWVPRKWTLQAYEFLRELGALQTSMRWCPDLRREVEEVPWQDQVQRELQRRQWLRQWGCTEEEMAIIPWYCTFAVPWLKGFSPPEVMARRAEQDLAEAEEDAKDARGRVRESKRNRAARSATGLTIERAPSYVGVAV